MENKTNDVEVLEDLIKINNDRIAGYQKALENLKSEDRDLRNSFTNMIDQSHKNKMALASAAADQEKDASNKTSFSGDVYRTWQDLKAAFTGHGRKSILENCAFGENAIQNAYDAALNQNRLSKRVRTLVSEQLAMLKTSHDTIEGLIGS